MSSLALAPAALAGLGLGLAAACVAAPATGEAARRQADVVACRLSYEAMAKDAGLPLLSAYYPDVVQDGAPPLPRTQPVPGLDLVSLPEPIAVFDTRADRLGLVVDDRVEPPIGGLSVLLSAPKPDQRDTIDAVHNGLAFVVELDGADAAALARRLDLREVPGAKAGRWYRRTVSEKSEVSTFQTGGDGPRRIDYVTRTSLNVFALDALPGKAYAGCEYRFEAWLAHPPAPEPGPAVEAPGPVKSTAVAHPR